MEIVNFITSGINKIFNILSTTQTIIGITWMQFFVGIILVSLVFSFVEAVAKGIQLERRIGDEIYQKGVKSYMTGLESRAKSKPPKIYKTSHSRVQQFRDRHSK